MILRKDRSVGRTEDRRSSSSSCALPHLFIPSLPPSLAFPLFAPPPHSRLPSRFSDDNKCKLRNVRPSCENCAHLFYILPSCRTRDALSRNLRQCFETFWCRTKGARRPGSARGSQNRYDIGVRAIPFAVCDQVR